MPVSLLCCRSCIDAKEVQLVTQKQMSPVGRDHVQGSLVGLVFLLHIQMSRGFDVAFEVFSHVETRAEVGYHRGVLLGF